MRHRRSPQLFTKNCPSLPIRSKSYFLQANSIHMLKLSPVFVTVTVSLPTGGKTFSARVLPPYEMRNLRLPAFSGAEVQRVKLYLPLPRFVASNCAAWPPPVTLVSGQGSVWSIGFMPTCLWERSSRAARLRPRSSPRRATDVSCCAGATAGSAAAREKRVAMVKKRIVGGFWCILFV